MNEDPSTAEFPAVERRGRGPGLYDKDSHPRQRHTDDGWRFWLPWLYKNTVPAIAIIIAAFAVNAAVDATSAAKENAAKAKANARAAQENSAANRKAIIAIQDSRRLSIREACEQDEAQANAVRNAIRGFGVGTRARPAPPAVVKAFAPLGGLRPLSEAEQARRCDERVKRGGP